MRGEAFDDRDTWNCYGVRPGMGYYITVKRGVPEGKDPEISNAGRYIPGQDIPQSRLARCCCSRGLDHGGEHL